MGTTSSYGLPYPEGTDLVIGGDDAIQSLAEAVASRLGEVEAKAEPLSQAAQINRANSGQSIGGGIVVGFPGTQSVMAGFTYDGAAGALVALGPPRLYLIDVEVQISLSSAGGTVSFESSIELLHAGSVIAGSYDKVTSLTSDLTSRDVVHRITTPGYVGTGQTLNVNASGGPNGVVGVVGIRVYPMGPAQP